jgi:hypothetical protein
MSKTAIVMLLFVVSLALVIFTSLIGASAVLSGGLANLGFGPENAGASSSAWPIGSLTILGVLSSLGVNVLRAQKQDEPLNFRVFFSAMLYPQTFIALFVSPVVFFGAPVSIGANQLGPAAYLAAFQNGFFWQRILDTKKE